MDFVCRWRRELRRGGRRRWSGARVKTLSAASFACRYIYIYWCQNLSKLERLLWSGCRCPPHPTPPPHTHTNTHTDTHTQTHTQTHTPTHTHAHIHTHTHTLSPLLPSHAGIYACMLMPHASERSPSSSHAAEPSRRISRSTRARTLSGASFACRSASERRGNKTN